METESTSHAELKWIHVEIANQDQSRVTKRSFSALDIIRQYYTLKALTLVTPKKLAGKMSDRQEDVRKAGQVQMSNGKSICLEGGLNEILTKSSEYLNSGAIAGSEMVVGMTIAIQSGQE